MLYVLIKYLLSWLICLIFRMKVYNRQGLNVKGAAIFVSNHLSLMDPVLIAVASPRLVHFMAKKELFTSWIARVFFKSLLAFPINRHTPDIASLRQAMEVLEKGKIFGIFPEGKRSVTGELDEIEKGSAFIALRSNAPVIPMYIHPDSFRKLHFRMIVGNPISREGLDGMSRSEMQLEFTRRIDEALHQLKRELEDKTCSC